MLPHAHLAEIYNCHDADIEWKHRFSTLVARYHRNAKTLGRNGMRFQAFRLYCSWWLCWWLLNRWRGESTTRRKRKKHSIWPGRHRACKIIVGVTINRISWIIGCNRRIWRVVHWVRMHRHRWMAGWSRRSWTLLREHTQAKVWIITKTRSGSSRTWSSCRVWGRIRATGCGFGVDSREILWRGSYVRGKTWIEVRIDNMMRLGHVWWNCNWSGIGSSSILCCNSGCRNLDYILHWRCAFKWRDLRRGPHYWKTVWMWLVTFQPFFYTSVIKRNDIRYVRRKKD